MIRFNLGMLFLYFPEDKTEYIPALLTFSVFLIACVLVFLWVRKVSKRQEEQAKKLEEQLQETLMEKEDEQNSHPLSTK